MALGPGGHLISILTHHRSALANRLISKCDGSARECGLCGRMDLESKQDLSIPTNPVQDMPVRLLYSSSTSSTYLNCTYLIKQSPAAADTRRSHDKVANRGVYLL